MTCATCNNWPDRAGEVPVGSWVEIRERHGAWQVETRDGIGTTLLHPATGMRRTLYPGERVRAIG